MLALVVLATAMIGQADGTMGTDVLQADTKATNIVQKLKELSSEDVVILNTPTVGPPELREELYPVHRPVHRLLNFELKGLSTVTATFAIAVSPTAAMDILEEAKRTTSIPPNSSGTIGDKSYVYAPPWIRGVTVKFTYSSLFAQVHGKDEEAVRRIAEMLIETYDAVGRDE